jgi:hypothetical protein
MTCAGIGIIAVSMRILSVLFVVLLAIPGAAFACRDAAARAEQRHRIPEGLLVAIAAVESGGYPWVLNAAGEARRYPSREAALAEASSLIARGVLPLDIGCMQISLGHHRGVFQNLAAAFDPDRNADYAARFLLTLFRGNGDGDWGRAVAQYHSRTAWRGDAYRRRVAAAFLRRPPPRAAAAAPRAAQAGQVTMRVVRIGE